MLMDWKVFSSSFLLTFDISRNSRKNLKFNLAISRARMTDQALDDLCFEKVFFWVFSQKKFTLEEIITVYSFLKGF